MFRSSIKPRGRTGKGLFSPLPGLTALLLSAFCLTAHAQATINVDGSQSGRTFYGVGAVSGGGGNSRLLYDYPAAQQAQILDYLFKPNYGASMQVLKVEIGGADNSTSGSEPSHEPVKGKIDCNAGYEWWLMAQAKARNPNIKISAAVWAVPGWVGGWSNDNASTYLMDWMNCARSHGLTIDYLDIGLNEVDYGSASWWTGFRSTLNSNGFASTQLLAGDTFGWPIADSLASNPAWASAVAAIGTHYPCGRNFGSETSCSGYNNQNALNSGLPLWQSEGGSEGFHSGAADMIRSIVRGYTDASLQAFINWPVIASVYRSMPWDTAGVIWANQPWSGWYSVGRSAWAMAHVTQFTQPGWTFINSASGYLSGNKQNGAYVTLKSPNGSDYSTIIETTTATAPQTVSIRVAGGLSTGAVHVWKTDLGGAQSSWFAAQPSITPNGGSYTLTLQPNAIYTISTLQTANKGTATSPAQAPLPLPYTDSFAGYPTGSMAKYLANISGDFQSQPCAGGRSGNCIAQIIPQAPSHVWDPNTFGNPWAVLGDLSWSNYTVSVDVLLQQSGYAYLAGRVNNENGRADPVISPDPSRPAFFSGYALQVDDAGNWKLLDQSATSDASKQPTSTVLSSGTIGKPGLNQWITLSLTFSGSNITASINHAQVASVNNNNHLAGIVGIGVNGFYTDQFSNLSITPVAGSNGCDAVPPSSATPYLWSSATQNWQSITDASVAAGTVVHLGPQPGSYLWSWTGSNGYFDGSREIDDIPLSPGANTYQATYLDARMCPNTQTYHITVTGGCTPTDITSYTWTQQSGWQSTSNVTVASGAVVDLGPQAGDGGSWSWTGPNGFTSNSREIDNIPLSPGENTFVVTYTNATGCQSTQTFVVTVSGPNNSGNSENKVLLNGRYTVEANGLFWDDYQGRTDYGTPVILWPSNSDLNQQWTFTALGDGYYSIINAYTGLALNVPGSSHEPHTGLIQWPYGDGSANAEWQVTPSGSGYIITNRESGQVVDSGGFGQGINIYQNTPNGSATQIWNIH